MSGATHKPALAYGINVIDNHLKAYLALFITRALFELFAVEVFKLLCKGQIADIKNAHRAVVVAGGKHKTGVCAAWGRTGAPLIIILSALR